MKFMSVEAPVAQWVKSWPADLEVPRSIPGGGNLVHHNKVPLHTAFHYYPIIILL